MDQSRDQLNQEMQSLNIFAYLNGLLSQVRSIEEDAQHEILNSDHQVQQQQQTSATIPSQQEAGGYPEDIFLFLTEKEKDEFSCVICYCILRNPHQCKNDHRFCYSCIYTWSVSKRGGSDFCPVCRCEALYAQNHALNEKIQAKPCCCKESGCNWKGRLRDKEAHVHRQYAPEEISLTGLSSSSNATSTVTNILPSRQSTSQLLRELRREGDAETSSTIPSGTTADASLLTRRSSQPSRILPTPGASSSRASQAAGTNSTVRRLSQASSSTPSRRSSVTSNTTNPLPRKPGMAARPTVNRTVSQQGSTSTSLSTASTLPPVAAPVTAPSLPRITAATSNSTGPPAPPALEYRRLVPLQRPADAVTSRLREGREQLAFMLTMMTLELEERRRNIHRQLALNAQRERVHAQQMAEVDALNRRLTRLSNSFDASSASPGNTVRQPTLPASSTRRRSVSPPWNASMVFASDSDSDF